MAILPKNFYNRPTEIVAKELLGKYLVRNGQKFMITETEAYVGPHDLASHSRFGPTKRNSVMFGPPGHAYVYLIYGMYYCLNVTTGHGSAVLIRATAKHAGPGILCRDLKIDRSFNGLDLTTTGRLYIIDNIMVTPRVGVKYAGVWATKPLRYVLVHR
ncbi:DNA-3-methyladenine glycosylase [Candidatus Amesbacteria bacterium]|nr:DNA-3-methyladenine glycosylase [Candidatus Amesbacteria bacterium]